MSADVRRCLAMVLAAGEGTRMRSAGPRCCTRSRAAPMIAHALAAAREAGAGDMAVVVGPGRDDVAEAALKAAPGAEVFVQRERRGTAHAVLAARAAIARGYDDVLVTYADIPLVRGTTLAAMRAGLADGRGPRRARLRARRSDRVRPPDRARRPAGRDPGAQGRDRGRAGGAALQRRSGRLSPAAEALAMLEAVTPDNAQSEYYLTDLVEIANARGLVARAIEAAETEVMGVNDRVQLAAAEAAMQERLRRRAMVEGATLVAPETVFLSLDTKIGRDVLIEPHVVIGPGVTIEDGAIIHAFSHLEGARVGAGATVGPYARLRPGARHRGEGEGRQFRRDQEGVDRGGRQGQPPDLYRRRAGRRGGQHRRRARSPATTTASASSGPTSARAPSSARTRLWSRPSRSATAPISARAR